MREDNFQERSEEATPKRKKEAREKGEVARSRELNTMLVVIFSGLGLWVFSKNLLESMQHSLQLFFTQPRTVLLNLDSLNKTINQVVADTLFALMPIFLISIIAVLLGPLLVGGWSFSYKMLAPKFGRMNPLKGLKKMVSLLSLVELIKTVAKFLIISIIGFFVIKYFIDDFLNLTRMPIIPAIHNGFRLSLQGFIVVSFGLIFIAAIDVPYQIYENFKKMRMTKQEIKDEIKETEGTPEVKSQIRRMQRELAQARMMEAIPAAAVILINPSHYSVAIRYNKQTDAAPILLAKGKDQIALRIRQVAKEHNIPILETPPLARAIYHTTRLNKEIPQGLYVTVAQVLAYLYQEKPEKLKLSDLAMPKEFAKYSNEDEING